jgi:cytochrome P450
VILDLLGVDREGYHYIRASARAISAFSPALYSPEPGQLQKIAETLRASAGFLRKLIAERRTHPRDDLVSALIRAEDSGQMLSEDEVIVLCNFLLFAGHETTANLMGTGLMYLLQRREQWELLLQDRALVPNAVEELLRYASPVAILARMVAEKLELHGQTLAEGDKVYVLIAAANRDPDEFSEPETLDIARHDARSLGFGYGAHFCIGAALARLETQMALTTLLDRFPNLRLASEQVEYLPIHWLRALKELRLAW